ncbi:hypothetical protein E2C01_054824 [Portunus trituberculatus]|uniref:Uncharacterized protein n=1 Tax=Portunus trituberculatus TaxID=210409 RepID=A0A5B7GUB5_PORTR|nr:hypothetical protein [Portunus trituberculatus]
MSYNTSLYCVHLSTTRLFTATLPYTTTRLIRLLPLLLLLRHIFLRVVGEAQSSKEPQRCSGSCSTQVSAVFPEVVPTVLVFTAAVFWAAPESPGAASVITRHHKNGARIARSGRATGRGDLADGAGQDGAGRARGQPGSGSIRRGPREWSRRVHMVELRGTLGSVMVCRG